MKVTKQRESGSSRTKRPNVRRQRITGSTGGSALDGITGGPRAVDLTGPANSAERAVAAIEQRRDAPTVPGTVTASSMSADAIQTQLTSSVTPGPLQIAEQIISQPPTQSDIVAAIAEGAATPFDELVAKDSTQVEAEDSLASDAEQAGKAEPSAAVPELDVERVKRQG